MFSLFDGRRFTPARLTRALEILEHYGLEDGIYHLEETDPEIAQQVANFLKDNRSKKVHD